MLRELDNDGAAKSLGIPDAYFHRFGPAPRDQAYFAVWDATGRRLAGSDVDLRRRRQWVGADAQLGQPAGTDQHAGLQRADRLVVGGDCRAQ